MNKKQAEFASYEANDPFVEQLMVHLDGLLGNFVSLLTPDNHKSLILILVKEVSAQMEKVALKSTYSRVRITVDS